MSMPRLSMAGVGKRFGPTVALDGVDLEVQPGTVHGLIGENGAGKSTLMKVLSGAIRPDGGRMHLDGERYAPRHPSDGRRAGVAMIYQELSLVPHLSVMENVLLGVESTVGPFMNWRAMRRRAGEALARVGRQDIDPAARVGSLAIARQQLVEIARSVAVGCRVLVLDEPTSSLGQADIDRLFALIRSLRDDGIAVVYISHFLEEVLAVCDQFTVLRDGQTVGSGRIADTDTDEIVSMMVGRSMAELYPRSARSPGDVLLNLEGLTGRVLPVDASLQVRRGEVVGISGLIGAGRTELLRAVFGLEAVRSGRVTVGRWSGTPSPSGAWSRGIGLVSEDRKTEGLAQRLAIDANLTLPRLDRLGSLGFLTPRAQRLAAEPWLKQLAVKCHSPTQRIDELSGGNQQKVAIGRLLFAGVDVLLLDEPTRGIDVGSKAAIYQLIDDLAAGRGSASGTPRAVLMVSSYLPELLGICDRIAVMHRGQLGPARPVSAWNEHTLMLEATGTG